MTIINQKSISGITSITFASAGDDLLTFHSNNGTERFRIDNSGNTKITAGIVTTLTVTGDVDIADKIVHTGDTNTAIRFPAADTITAETAGSERLRITSAGLIGIGTVSPSGPIHVHVTSGSQRSYLEASASHTFLRLGAGSTSYNSGLEFFSGASNIANINGLGAGGLQFEVNGSERFRITSTGQVKVGNNTLATPNGNADNFIIDTGDADSGLSILSATTGRIYFGDAADAAAGSIRYVHSDNSMRFEASGGEKLRIDSDGRLLVGATTARGNFYNSSGAETRFLVEGTTFTTSSAALVRNSNNASDAELVLAKSRGTSVGSNTVVQDDDNLGAISFQGSDGAQFVEAASITAFVDATPGSNDMPGRISFAVTSDGASTTTERMRINRKGFLKVGPRITDGSNGVADLDSVRHEFTSDDNGWTMILTHTSGSSSEHEGILIDYNNDPNGTGNSFLQGNAGSTTRFRMASNGGLYNYSSNNSNLSDEREKKNIVSLDSKWDKVKSWDLKKFHYNEDADSDDLRYGVIAQQVEQHCPEVLTDWVKQESKDAVLDEDGNVVTPAVAEVTRKAVKEQQMMWMAIKALQEAQTRIETLETQNTAQQTQINDLITRVTALEG